MAGFFQPHHRVRIVLVGLLHDTNLGDPAIFQITRHSIQEYCKSRRIEAAFDYVDIGEYQVPRFDRPALNRRYENARNRLWHHLFKRSFTIFDRVKLDCGRAIKRNSSAVIFVGGSIIKFKRQEYLHKMIDIVLRRADKLNVPVMFSGVGLEGYEDNNEACELLKSDLNRYCVKVITVRDDIKTLQTSYLNANSPIRTAKVSDAACSLKKMYSPSSREKNTVGLGIIRSDIFAEYGNCVSDDELLNLYADIYRQIIKRGKKCVIFSNGVSRDQIFAEKLASYITGEKVQNVYCFPQPHTVADLVAAITRCEAVIATRLHAAVIAYAYEIPFVGLIWNSKQRFFGESICLPDRFLKSQSSTPNGSWISFYVL